MDPTTVRSSSARRTGCASALALVLALGTVPAGPPVERRVAAAPGGSLSVELRSGGEVRIRAGADDAVLVTARGRGTGDPVAVRDEGGRVVVTSTPDALPGLEVDIEVPSRFDVAVDTAGGDVTVRGVEGRVSVTTAGGDLEAEGLAGTVDLVTAGGDVAVRDVAGTCRVRSFGGDVRLDRVVADLEVSTLGGDVVSAGRAGGRYELRTTGGDIDVEESPDGSVLETLGGSIRVGRAAGDLTLETQGGHIEAYGVGGSLRATTLAGSVDAEIVGAPRRVRLEARQGDVRLTVPGGLGARWDVDVSWSRGAVAEGRIHSAVPLETRRSAGRQAEGGEPRQYLTGRGRTGDGTTEVSLRVLDGNVTIREAR